MMVGAHKSVVPSPAVRAYPLALRRQPPAFRPFWSATGPFRAATHREPAGRIGLANQIVRWLQSAGPRRTPEQTRMANRARLPDE